MKCPVYEKLRKESVDAARRFQQAYLRPPTSAEFSQAIFLRNATRERALAHTRKCLLCENTATVSSSHLDEV